VGGNVRKADRKFAEEYVHRAKAREFRGLAVYGEYDPQTDKRIMAVEAQNEVLDTYVYLKMLKKKHPVLRDEAISLQAKACALYADLRRLEEKELALNSKEGG
jgi:hypothetical protein